MQPDGSESDSMADYNTSAQPDQAEVQQKVEYVFNFLTIFFLIYCSWLTGTGHSSLGMLNVIYGQDFLPYTFQYLYVFND